MILWPIVTLEQMDVAYMTFYCMMFCFKVGVNDLGALGVAILSQVFLPCRFFQQSKNSGILYVINYQYVAKWHRSYYALK